MELYKSIIGKIYQFQAKVYSLHKLHTYIYGLIFLIYNLFNIQQNIAIFASLNDALSIVTVVKMTDINNKRSKCPASYFIFLIWICIHLLRWYNYTSDTDQRQKVSLGFECTHHYVMSSFNRNKDYICKENRSKSFDELYIPSS